MSSVQVSVEDQLRKTHIQAIRWALLLSTLFGAMVLEPIFGSSVTANLLSLALLQISVVGALFVSAPPGKFRTLLITVSTIWFLATFLSLSLDLMQSVVTIVSLIMLLASLVATFASLASRMDGSVDSILGGVFGYFLLAMIWAIFFVQIARWSPAAFAIPDNHDLLSSMVYFSLVTLTTLGYGDVLPISPVAQVAAGIEAAVGVLYIAVLVGGIVGNYRHSK